MNILDLDRAVDRFATSEDFTVGIEEEFSILDRETLELVPATRSSGAPRTAIRCFAKGWRAS